ncbi:MAG: proline racemase family protein [Acidobacteriota bacterium]
MQRVAIVDSHTGGEPTRVVLVGGPDLGSGTISDRLIRFRAEHDRFRSAVVNEPRGNDVIVGALLCTPVNPAAAAGVIFFNNVGFLGMCGHGTIGLVATLAHMGRIGAGEHLIETPVGDITATLHASGEVSIRNVASYRTRTEVSVHVDGFGPVIGDVAYGGNWFFLVSGHSEEIALGNVEHLTQFAWRIRRALEQHGVTGTDRAEIDHIELVGLASEDSADARNFVLCPGKAYDRSPCGTGTSAKLACLAADGRLGEGELWRQESVTGSVFEGSYVRAGVVNGFDAVIPTIKGSAFVNAEATLILDPGDPFCYGIRS